MKKQKKQLPHHGVYVRLGVSRVHGIGVFAIRDIRKGTLFCQGDDADLVWIPKIKIKGLPKETRRLYQDFCVFKGSMAGCPRNFNVLTVAWYLNDSKKPNVGCNKDYDFFALRDIKKGEELTVDYDTYSDE